MQATSRKAGLFDSKFLYGARNLTIIHCRRTVTMKYFITAIASHAVRLQQGKLQPNQPYYWINRRILSILQSYSMQTFAIRTPRQHTNSHQARPIVNCRRLRQQASGCSLSRSSAIAHCSYRAFICTLTKPQIPY